MRNDAGKLDDQATFICELLPTAGGMIALPGELHPIPQANGIASTVGVQANACG